MRKILVIGIGAGDPRHITLQAIEAIGQVDTFFFLDKGTAPELVRLRHELLRHHAVPGHRVVTLTDPERDRAPADYDAAVRAWHAARAQRVGAAINGELGRDGIGGLLVWGDPSLYDSTLRILDQLRTTGGASFEIEVIPGVSSLHALAAAFGIPLHDIGAPLLVTTGRRLAADFAPDVPNAVVMLDGQQAFTEIEPTGVEIYWGAYVSTSDQVLVTGLLADVADDIVAERAAAREQHGWIMDVYLLRRATA